MPRTHHVRSGQLGSQRVEAWLGDRDWSQSDLPSVLA